MARKDDTDFDDFSLDEFGFDDGPDFSMDPPKDDRSPILKASTSFVEGVTQTAKDPAFAKRIIKSSLPAGYGKALDAVDEVAGSARELYNSAAAELKPSMLELKRVSRSILPKVRGAIPDSLTKKLEKFLADEEVRSGQAKEEAQETQLTLELGEIFKAKNEAEVDREARATTESRLRDGIRNNQHEATFSQIDSMRKGVDRLVGYQDSITIQYQRKSLELQYRQFFVLRDTLVHHKESYAESLSNLQAISKNTALPEFVKINNSEFAAQAIKERLYGGLADSFSDYSRNFKARLFGNIKDKVMGNVQRFSEGISAGAGMLEQVQMMQEMGESVGGISTSQMAGNMAGSSVAGSIGDWLGKKIKGQLGKNDKVNQTSDKLLHFFSNIPAAMNDLAKGNKFEDGPLGGLVRAGKELIPTYALNTAVASKDKERAHEAVPFSLLTRKSIIEIIPGYLSRILQEIQITRTGDESIDRIVFNHDRDQFTSAKIAAKDISSSIFSADDISSTNVQVDGVADLLLRGVKISKGAKEKFKHLLLTDAAKGIHFTAERYSDPENLGTEIKSVERKQIASIIRKTFGIDSKGNFSSAKGTTLQAKVGRHFGSMRDSIKNQRAASIDYAELGNRELLRDLGLFVKDGVDDRLDYDSIWDVYRNGRVEEGNGQNDKGKGPRKTSHNRSRPVSPNNANDAGGFGGTTAMDSQKNGSSSLESAIRDSNEQLIAAIEGGYIVEEARQTSTSIDYIIKILESGALGGGGGGGMTMGAGFTKLHKGFTGAIGSAAKGLWDAGGKFYSGAFSGMGSLLKGAGELGGGILTRAGGMLKNGVGDIYVNGESTPALFAYKMKKGDYYMLRGKKRVVIRKMNDLFGPGKISNVYDSADNDNVALSIEQIKRGLTDARGTGLITKGLKFIGDFYSGLLSPVTAGIGLAVNAVKGVGKFITKQRDIYVKGETTPRILASVMAAEGYFSEKTGNVVRSIKDFDGNIVDKDGNIVLSLDDMRKGLVDRFGGKIEGVSEKLLSTAVGLAKLPFKLMTKGINFGKDLLKGGTDFIGSLLSSLTGGTTKSGDLLEEIRDILKERLPKPKRRGGDSDGDGDRDGSWQDQFSRKGKGKGNNRKGKRKSGNVRTTKAADKADEESDFGISDAVDAYEVAKDAGGLLKKAGGWVKNSRLGGLAASGLASLVSSGGVGAIVNGAIAGGSMLATGAAGLATAIGGILTAPVVLGIGAAVAVGAAGYYGYKYFTRKDMPLARVRFAQYGVDADDEDEVAKVLSLEDKLLPGLKYTKGTSAEITRVSVNLEDVLKEFDVDVDDKDDVEVWVTWFAKRFKPVFQLHAGTLNDLAPSVKLAEVDDKLSKTIKLAFLDKVKFDTNNKDCPYNVEAGAFGSADTDAEDVADVFSEAYDKVNAMPEDAPSAEVKGEGDKGNAPKLLATAVTAVAAGKGGSFLDGVMDGLGISPTVLKLAPLTGLAGAAITAGSIIGSFITDSRLDAMTCVRLKAYGLVTLETDHVKAILALENAVAERLTYDSKGLATFKEGAEVYLRSMGSSFGIVSGNEDDVIAWISWFTNRFIPVLLTYCTALRMIGPNIKVREAGKVLKAEQLLDVAKAIISSKATVKDDSISVWLVEGSPFPHYSVNKDVKSTDGNMAALKSAVKETEYKDAVEKQGSVKTYGAPVGVLKPGATGPVDFRNTPSPLISNRSPQVGGNSVLGAMAGGTYTATDLMKGRGIVQPGKGTGGDINLIPMPTGDGSWAAVKDTIVAASKMAGVDASLMATMASIESGFRSTVKAGTSSATGLYQFISGTWKAMLNKYGSKYGIDPNTPPSDPRANALMGAEFLKENAAALEKGLGRTPTDTDVYLAHFMGAGGAVNLLKGDPNAIAANISPKAAAANKSIFYEGVRPRTLAEVYAVLDRKVKGHASASGGDTSSSAPVASTIPAVAATAGVEAAASPSYAGPMAAPQGVPTPAAPGIASYAPATASVTPANIAQAPLMMKVADTGSSVLEERKQLAERAATVTEVQSKSVNEAMNGSMGQMLDVLNKSLLTQQSMDASLKEISTKLNTGAPNTVAPVTQQVAAMNTPVQGKRPGGVEAKQAPISMKQTG